MSERMVDNRILVRVALLGAALLGVLVVFSGCGHTNAMTVAYKAKGAAADFVTATYSTWRDFDVKHQKQLLANAKSKDEFESQIMQWRATQDKVDIGFTALRLAVVEYSDALAAVEAGKQGDVATILNKLVLSVQNVIGLLAEVGIHVNAPKMGV